MPLLTRLLNENAAQASDVEAPCVMESHRFILLLLGWLHAQQGLARLAVVLALLRVGDSHIDFPGRHGLGENRWRWGEVGRPIRDGTRSDSIPEVGIEVAVFREAFCVEVEG